MDIFGGHSVTESLIQQTSWNKLKGSNCMLMFAHKCPVKNKLQLWRTSRETSWYTEPELESIQRGATHLLSCMSALSATVFSGSSWFLLEFGEHKGKESWKVGLFFLWFKSSTFYFKGIYMIIYNNNITITLMYMTFEICVEQVFPTGNESRTHDLADEWQEEKKSGWTSIRLISTGLGR